MRDESKPSTNKFFDQNIQITDAWMINTKTGEEQFFMGSDESPAQIVACPHCGNNITQEIADYVADDFQRVIRGVFNSIQTWLRGESSVFSFVYGREAHKLER